MDDEIADREALRREIRGKYRDVAVDPERSFDFYTGRALAHRLGYRTPSLIRFPTTPWSPSPARATPSRCAVSGAARSRGRRLGPGFDAFIAAGQVGDQGRVAGIDMTPEMITKSRASAGALGLRQVEFREGLAEALPIEDDWADVVISNGAINLCADKRTVLAEIHRALRPGGALQFADVANGRPVPPEDLRDIDLLAA